MQSIVISPTLQGRRPIRSAIAQLVLVAVLPLVTGAAAEVAGDKSPSPSPTRSQGSHSAADTTGRRVAQSPTPRAEIRLSWVPLVIGELAPSAFGDWDGAQR